MSAYASSNYGPPPQNDKTNLVNGLPAQQEVLRPPLSQQAQFHQQQQVLQQKQQQQAPVLHSNMSKFMPPSTSATLPPSMNGPPSQAFGSSLPPHLRQNGPPGVVPLVNGGSADSSRTSSPLHQQSSLPPQQHLQQQSGPPPTQFGAQPAGALPGSMQRLNLNGANGHTPPIQPQIGPPLHRAINSAPNLQQIQQPQMPPTSSRSAAAPPPQQQQQQHQFTPNFHGNFKTSALNAGPKMPLPASLPPQQQTGSHIQQPMQPPPPTMQQPLQPPHPSSQMDIMQPPPLSNTPSSQAAQLPRNTSQRKPMYPTNTQLPPMQTSQQQPYAQAFHQQPPPNVQHAGLFNGQPSAGPLQYQPQTHLPPQQQQQTTAPITSQYNQPMNVVQQGFNQLWGQDTMDLMQHRRILTSATLARPRIVLHNQFHESINCNPNIMRCTIAKIPESNSLLQKSRLPLGILIHPFRDINSLPVIQCPSIVRCRLCRTYINPFVYFVDSKMWKCNLCYRVNELPEDFQFDPATKTYGDVTRRPEVRSSTIEFIAPSEYMLRPPQPAIYLFLFDVSIIAQQSGYLENVCAVLNKHLEEMPGDARTQVGFIAYNSQVHFYSISEGFNQPHEMTLLDIEDPFLPRPDSLLVNLKECRELVKDLLTQLPKRFADTHDPGSAMGAALQVAYKLMQSSGGRVTVFQTCLPNKGPGSLEPRENPNNRSAKDVAHLNPATDYYKRFALDCSGYQIAVDLFLLNQQYSDLATIAGMSKHSGGCVHHFPLYQSTKPQHVESLRQCLRRYLVRKIGFEAVMRVRCTRGLQVHTFHGNFFVRSTDLLSLPNVNPDAGYGMQISYEENLTDVKTICFQVALLYTNSEGERRIRVHTLCLPVTGSLPEVMHAADSEAIVSLLSKMAVDRSLSSNVADAREAFINATIDIFNAFKLAQNLPAGQSGQLIAPRSLALLPLYILALLKHPAFRVGTSTRLDDRVNAMDSMKTLPLDQLMKFIYPEFYNIDALFYSRESSNAHANGDEEEEDDTPDLPRLQLSAEYLDSRSIFLLDCGTLIILYVGLNVPTNILERVLGISSTAQLPDYCYDLPELETEESEALKRFLIRQNDEKPYAPIVQIIRDTSTAKPQFIEKLVDDRSESSLSYYEFLQHIRAQVK